MRTTHGLAVPRVRQAPRFHFGFRAAYARIPISSVDDFATGTESGTY
jgi:hypothetical protein